MIRLLCDPLSNPSLIRWEDESAYTFRLVQPGVIAFLWSSRRFPRPDFTYSNFSRGLRYVVCIAIYVWGSCNLEGAVDMIKSSGCVAATLISIGQRLSLSLIILIRFGGPLIEGINITLNQYTEELRK